MSKRERPVVHASETLGSLLESKVTGQKFIAFSKMRQEVARERFLQLEDLTRTAFDTVRKAGHFIPRDWVSKAYPAIRTLAGAVGTFDQGRFDSARRTLEWAANSPADFQDALKVLNLR